MANADFCRRFGQPEGYVRVHGISALCREGMVLEYVQATDESRENM